MLLIDLHCDTVSACLKQGKDLLRNDLAIDLARGCTYAGWIQTFAFWIPDQLRGQAAFDHFAAQNALFERDLAAAGGKLRRYRGEATLSKGVCYAIKAVESGAALAGEISHIEDLYRAGVKYMTLCWNEENELASGAHATGGFKPFGRQVVKEMERRGIVADVSHLNEEGFWELCSFAKKPFVATHSNAYAVTPHPRNLKDDQIRALVARGGLIGINFYNAFLSENPTATREDLFRHIDRFLSCGAQDILALGSDFDGALTPDFIKDVGALAKLAQSMIHYYGKTLTEKIFSGNAMRFFKTLNWDTIPA